MTLTNQYTDFNRVINGRISVALADGQFYSNWKSGQVTLGAGETYTRMFKQVLPNLRTVIGANTFTPAAEDTTPAPYNQPPYHPSGDTDTSACTVTGVSP